MGYRYEEQMLHVIAGYECDACGEEFDGIGLMSSVGIEHEFGYESGHDQEAVEAVLCEPCYYKMLRAALPGRCFKS